MRLMRKLTGLVGLAVAMFASPALADTTDTHTPACDATQCTYRVTAEQLLTEADRLVSLHLFADAAPLLKALEATPKFAMERRFLQGYSAIEQGRLDDAIGLFRAVLVDHPEQTRVRLELARALQMKGKYGSADHHFRLAQEDKNLPDEVVRSIRTTRGLLRDRRSFGLTVDVGLAPDSNITNGTNAESVDVNFGGFLIPLTLDPTARQRSGIGQSMVVSSSYRTRLSGSTKLLIETDGQAMNYEGKAADDFALQFAAGPEIQLSENNRLTVQGLGLQRWFGGKSASTGGGARLGFQHDFNSGHRLGLNIDARYAKSGFSDAYTGWSLSAQTTYERVIASSMIGYVSVFGRRELLNSKSFSGHEVGSNIGIMGDLPLGISIGLSGGISRAAYDAPLPLFSADPRKDWRYNARAQVGLRSLRFWGFSPSVTYDFNRTDSSLTLYKNDRHRVRFGFARYF